MGKIKVVLFAANPPGTELLDLPREFREIETEIRVGEYRDALELIFVPGARLVDLLRKLNDARPQIVHFSGHGSLDAEILLEDEADLASGLDAARTRSANDRDITLAKASPAIRGPDPLDRSVLADVLKSCDEGNIRVVVLNACHTRHTASALASTIDCVVSMKGTISDRAAIKFAASFYGALAFGRSVRKAFDQGVSRLRAHGVEDADAPELIARNGVDPARLVLAGPANELSPSGREASLPFRFPGTPTSSDGRRTWVMCTAGCLDQGRSASGRPG